MDAVRGLNTSYCIFLSARSGATMRERRIRPMKERLTRDQAQVLTPKEQIKQACQELCSCLQALDALEISHRSLGLDVRQIQERIQNTAVNIAVALADLSLKNQDPTA